MVARSIDQFDKRLWVLVASTTPQVRLANSVTAAEIEDDEECHPLNSGHSATGHSATGPAFTIRLTKHLWATSVDRFDRHILTILIGRYADILEDMKEECSKFGTVEGIEMPKEGTGKTMVYIKFDSTSSSATALKNLDGRSFENRKVEVRFCAVTITPQP